MTGFTNAHLDPDTAYSETLDAEGCTVCGADAHVLTSLDGEHVCESCYLADSCVPTVYSGGPTASPVYPTIERQRAVEADTADLLAHLLDCGPLRFNARAKMEAAEAYTLRKRGGSLAVPTKLANVSLSQPAVAAVAARMEAEGTEYLPCRLFVGQTLGGRPEVVVLAETERGKPWTLRGLGFVQDKHAGWLAPLLATEPNGAVTDASSPVRVYVTAVTGGTESKPTRGVNVVLVGCADAVRKAYDGAAVEAMREAAYGSGAGVEALID